MLTLELLEEREAGTCACCSKPIRATMTGVRRDGELHAMCLFHWSADHAGGLDARIIVADDWSEDDPRGHVAVFLVKITAGADGFSCSFMEPEHSPWPGKVFGIAPLTRDAALKSPRLREAVDITEVLVHEDPRAKRALGLL